MQNLQSGVSFPLVREPQRLRVEAPDNGLAIFITRTERATPNLRILCSHYHYYPGEKSCARVLQDRGGRRKLIIIFRGGTLARYLGQCTVRSPASAQIIFSFSIVLRSFVAGVRIKVAAISLIMLIMVKAAFKI